MARYFFHTTNGSVDRDIEGTEFDDVGDARLAAVTYLAEMLRDRPQLLGEVGNFRVALRDEAGGSLFDIVVTANESRPHSDRRPDCTADCGMSR
jgi:hypothetical protein